MHRTLKAALALLCLAELIASTPLPTSSLPKLKLSDITRGIQQLNRGEQVRSRELMAFPHQWLLAGTTD